MASKTDIEDCGLVRDNSRIEGRHLIITNDFEAFRADSMPLWRPAMKHWAVCSQKFRLPTSFFVALEDAAALSHCDGAGYAALIDGLRDLVGSGAELHPHNHFLFDPLTGVRPTSENEPVLPDGYTKRLSMFFDVVHRHGLPIGPWLETLREIHAKLMSDVGRASPRRLAFRAGGWDYGSSCDELSAYVEGLARAGFAVDSSACRGRFGTTNWLAETPFGSNVFRLKSGVLEIGPSLHLNCGRDSTWRLLVDLGLALRRHPGLLRRQDGALVVVLHFDHLFHEYGPRGAQENFVVKDFNVVRGRIDCIFQALQRLKLMLGLKATTFSEAAVL